MPRDRLDDPVAGEAYDLVPPGKYIVLVERAEVGPGWPDRRMGRPRKTLYLRCRILEGQFKKTMIPMPMNITFKNGRARPGSAFYDAWTVAMDRKPTRGEPMNRDAFDGKVFAAEVVTVTRDSLGRVRPEVTQYSRVGRLIALLGTRDAYLRPQTEHGRTVTEYPIPPFPGDSKGISKGYGTEINTTSDGRNRCRTVGCQRQEKQPGGGSPDSPREPAPSTPTD